MVTLALVAGFLMPALHPTPATALLPPPTLSTTFGDALLSLPLDVATDTGGNVYVADGPRVRKFSSAGALLLTFGIETDLQSASSVAVAADGSVFVADGTFNKIIKFQADGTPIGGFGTPGTGNGQFAYPTGLAIDIVGNLWVVDKYNSRVQKFNSGGTHLATYGSFGTGSGQFKYPSDLVIKGTSAYVLDQGNSRVQTLSTTNGAVLGTWGSAGSGPGQLYVPWGIAIDASDNLYVIESGRVQRFTTAGVFLSQWGNGGGTDGKLWTSGGGVVVGSSIWVADSGNARVQKFGLTGAFQARIGGVGGNRLARPAGIAANYSNVFVVDRGLHQVLKFSLNGTFQAAYGGYGNTPGSFITPSGIALDGAGNLWIADSGNNRLQKISPLGASLVVTGGWGTGDGQFKEISGVAVDAAGNVYASDSDLNRVQVFTSAGAFLRSFPAGTGDFLFDAGPIEVDAAGTVWVADLFHDKVRRFTSTGTLLTATAAPLANGRAFDIDSTGSLLVANDVPAFKQQSASGVVLRSWTGSSGTDPGDFLAIADVHGRRDDVYVSDDRIGRITKLSSPVTLNGFVGVTPTRVLDTRTGTGVAAGKLGPNATLTFAAAGAGGVDPAATAVVLNITATDATTGTYLTAFPNGSARPGTANLLVPPNTAIPNLVTVKVGDLGKLQIYNQLGSVHVIADVFGYYVPTSTNFYDGMQPSRVLDTRTGKGVPAGKIGPNSSKDLTVAGVVGGAPANATAVIMNVTVTQGDTPSYLTVYPATGSTPNAANLLFVGGQTVSNLVTVPVSSGKVRFYNNSGNVHVIADLVGYYTPMGGGTFVPIEPERAFDTRTAIGGPLPLANNASRTFPVGGVAGVDRDARGVVMNITATGGTQASYLTVYPEGVVPTAASLLFAAGQTVPNAVISDIGGVDDSIRIYNQQGQVHVIGDVTGYFLPAG